MSIPIPSPCVGSPNSLVGLGLSSIFGTGICHYRILVSWSRLVITLFLHLSISGRCSEYPLMVLLVINGSRCHLSSVKALRISRAALIHSVWGFIEFLAFIYTIDFVNTYNNWSPAAVILWWRAQSVSYKWAFMRGLFKLKAAGCEPKAESRNIEVYLLYHRCCRILAMYTFSLIA